MKQTPQQKKASRKRYYFSHKEEHAEWSRKYYLDHKDEYKARAQQYYQENKAELNEKHRRYYQIQKTKERNQKQSSLVSIIEALPSLEGTDMSSVNLSADQIAVIEDMLLEAIDVISKKTKYRELCIELMQKADIIFKLYRTQQ